MRRAVLLAAVAVACGGSGRAGAPPPALAAGAGGNGDGTPTLGPADLARCAALVPAELPPAVTYACDGAGSASSATSDADGSHVALGSSVTTADGATITYRFVPMAGGPPEPGRPSGRWGVLLPRPRGYYWLTQPLPLGGAPVDAIAPDGTDAGPVPGLAPTLMGMTTPDGGLVAWTVQGFDGTVPIIRQELVSGSGVGEGALDPAVVGWIFAVNVRGHMLTARGGDSDHPSYRWIDGELAPLTPWFEAPPVGWGAAPLVDGSLLAGGAIPFVFRDASEELGPAPGWFAADRPITTIVRGGTGYAVDPREGGCELEIVTADAVSCGRLKLPIARCDAFVGADGTVFAVQRPAAGASAPCSWSWWPGLLR